MATDFETRWKQMVEFLVFLRSAPKPQAEAIHHQVSASNQPAEALALSLNRLVEHKANAEDRAYIEKELAGSDLFDHLASVEESEKAVRAQLALVAKNLQEIE